MDKMETNDEEQLLKNGLMFIFVRQNKPIPDKIVNLENILNDGADINFRDSNHKKNTILHIAVQKSEKDVVKFLIKKGALLSYNTDNKTPIHFAKEIDTKVSKEIVDILTAYGKYSPHVDNSNSIKRLTEAAGPQISICENSCSEDLLYQKRAGTSGVSGQFYETKLLSLIHHRAIHDNDIEECYLAANIKDIGDFDDVCFRFKMNEHGKTRHVLCFTQAKHREDPDKARLTVPTVRSVSGQFSLAKYYDSFLKIKQKFFNSTKSIDPMFKGEFKDIDCYFILYTLLKESFERKLSGNKPFCRKLLKFIYTGDKEGVFQFDYEHKDIEFLTKFIQQERIKALGKVFLSFILTKPKEMMTNDLIQIYHPALAQYVIECSKSQDPNYITGIFQDAFFDSDNDLLVTLKETLFKEIVFTRIKPSELSKDEVKDRIRALVDSPCTQTISMLIGEVIYFDDKNNKLCLDLDKKCQKKFKQEEIREIRNDLLKVQVTSSMVKDAINIIGKDKLKLLTFQLPYTFGNSDVPSNLKNKDASKDRLDFLASKFISLINAKKEQLLHERNEINYPIQIDICDDNVGPKKILEHSHLNTKGIGGTVGNLLKFDIQRKTFAFNTDDESLPINAKYMLQEIKRLINDDLSKFSFNVQMNTFPRICFSANQNDNKLAKEFFSKLWFFTNQAKEEAVESILKKEIDDHYNADKHQSQFLFRVHSDAIFLRYHDEIQKWWKSQTQARYLTKTDTIFEEAKKDIIDSPVLTVLNIMFIRMLKKIDIKFNLDTINLMELDKMTENQRVVNIVTDSVIISAIKMKQVIKYQNNFTFINLDYVHMLPENDYNTMMNELKDIKSVSLVIIREASVNEQLQDSLHKIVTTFTGPIFIITDQPLQLESTQACESAVFKDEYINLENLDLKSQTKFLTDNKVNYQGKEITLDTILDESSKSLVDAKLLWSILNKDKIEIGQPLDSHKYNEIKDYYINRSLFRDGEEFEVNTFDDIDDKIVLITSKPCMGKTILLTHLALETKKSDPQHWIVRINMANHSNDFSDWPDRNLTITHVMRFLCKAALKKSDETKNLNFIQHADGTIDISDLNSSDISFELKCFVNFFNCGKIIFLFDGFDRIYGIHTKDGIELLKALKHANQRMWITCDCYVIHLLARDLGIPYKLDSLTAIQQESFLNRFWKTNLKLEKLNHEQFNNIHLFMNYILKFCNPKLEGRIHEERPWIPLLSIPLHVVYLSAVKYFKNEINNISPRFLREKIKKKWGLNRYTEVDRFLRRPDEDESLELTGTPLHMYIAANYFELQIKDKFDLHINGKEIIKKSNIYLNTIKSYERFLKVNMKIICEIENRNIEKSQEKARDDFFETHKKLALYAICKESDVTKLLTEPEIREVKEIIRRVESGEIKSQLIDCVVDGIPRFYNLIFAEYFLVEFATDLIRRVVNSNCDNIELQSLWDFIVNGLLMLCPHGVRNAFEYKLKYDPELLEVASNDKCDKIIFDLIMKQNKKAVIVERDNETSLNIAINEGLVNVTNLLLKGTRRYVTEDNVDGFVSILKTGAFILGAANPSWKELTDNMLHCIREVDGKKLIEILNSNQTENVSRSLTSLCGHTEFGQSLQKTIKKDLCEPIRRLTDNLVTLSSNNENVSTLVELLPYHLPDIVNSLFGKK